MALGIYLGGTTGAADGTLEVPGDGTGLTLGAIGSVGTLHIRAASGKRNAEQVTVNAPTDCEVSADGTTYAATAVYAIGAIQDVNVALYVKRTAGTTALTTGGTTTPRLSLITEEVIPVPDTTAPVLSGTLVATAGDGQVVLDWPDATDAVGVTGYDVEYGTTTGYGSTITDPTASTATITGLTNGTLYYFRVRAHDLAGNVSGYLTASATPLSAAPASFVNDFSAGESLNSHLHLFSTGSSSAVVGSNLLTLTRGTDGSAGWSCDIPIAKTANTRIKMRYKRVSGAGASSMFVLRLFHDSAYPTADTEFPSALAALLFGYNDSADAGYLRYSNSTSSAWNGWDFTNNSWSVPAAGAAGENIALSEGTIAETWIEFEANGGSPQVRFIQKDASGNTVSNGTTAWVPITLISDWSTTTESFFVGGYLSSFAAVLAITKIAVEAY